MTPKEKAEQLVAKYRDTIMSFLSDNMKDMNAKQCALIAVDEIIRLNIFDCNDEWSDEEGDTREYWKEVKQEIEKL